MLSRARPLLVTSCTRRVVTSTAAMAKNSASSTFSPTITSLLLFPSTPFFATRTLLYPFGHVTQSANSTNVPPEGHFKLELKDVIISKDRYTVLSSKGSGPGGQAVNASSNKAEVHLDVSTPLPGVDSETWSNFLKEEAKHLMDNGRKMKYTSHDSRSLNVNVEKCIEKIKDALVRASYVPPPPSAVPVIAPWMKEDRIAKKKLRGTKTKNRIMRDL
eukprot:PhM_4_TR14877/c0_g1_i1/m.30131/K15033/ICT1; peptidyl-tRNA hydrolase ICT1